MMDEEQAADLNDAAKASILESLHIFPPEWADVVRKHLDENCDWEMHEDLSVTCVTHDVVVLPDPYTISSPISELEVLAQSERITYENRYFQRGELPPERLK